MADKESKKRKRLSNGTGSPNKKVALKSPTGNAGRIAVSFVDEEGLKPALLSAHGIAAPKIPLKAYVKKTANPKTNESIDPATHDLLLHSSQHPRLDYVASPNTLEAGMSHYIAVFDPATNRLEVTPAHSLILRSSLRSELQDVEKERLSNLQKREELGREFGTKKAKKAIASKMENAIITDTKGKGQITDVQTAILDSVGEATAGAASHSAEAKAEALLASKPIPKPNLAAQEVEDVYAFSTLLPPGDARLVPVKDWQDKARGDEAILFSHRFPASRASKLGKGDDVQRLKALRYLTLLLEFHAALGSGRKKVPKREVLSKKLAAWPPQLVDSVRRRFTNDTGSELGKWQLDNLHTHICAFALYVDGWITDTSQLKEDLQLETKQLSQYFSELGCKVLALTEAERNARQMNKAVAAVTRMAKLVVPPNFPKPRAGRRR